jgi:methionyl-tRNA formyltransferase
LRTVFLGTTDFAAAILGRLAESGHRPQLVLTRPDRPRGRGRRVEAPPVAQTARELGIAVEQPASVNDPSVCESIERAGPGVASAGEAGAGRTQRTDGVDELVLVVCAFGALIKEPLLSSHAILNVHPSLLPRWRGAAPIERAIMAGDAETGVSIMRLTAGLDSGPVCAAAREAIAPGDTYGSLAQRLHERGGELLVEVLDRWEGGAPPSFTEQEESGVTYAEKISAEDRLLDPTRPAVELERRVRALHPHIGARVALVDGTLLGVLHAAVHGAAALAGESGSALPAGTLVGQEGRLLYGTGVGALELLRVQSPGGRPMDAAAYLRGHAI